MAPPLPQFVAISSTTSKKKYFRPSGPSGEVKSEEVDEVSVYKVKHVVVPSTSQPGMIHLKCVDTGKYWSWGLNRASLNYISAQQTKRVSDLSSNACTLIKYSHHTSNGASVFHLEFRRNSKWHAIKKDCEGFLKSAESKDGHSYTNFVIEDWQAARASRNKKNTGGGTSTGNGVAIGKLYVDKMICVVPSTSQPHQPARASKDKKNTGGGTSGGNIINGVAIGELYVNKMICVMPGTSQPFKNILNGQVRHLPDGKDKAKNLWVAYASVNLWVCFWICGCVFWFF